jgi:hypothetical protein
MDEITRQSNGDSGERRAHEAGRIAKARASAAAGRVVALADMVAWADSLDSGEIIPVPRTRP